MRRNETANPKWMEFCTLVGIPDILICANFGDDQLRDMGRVVVKFCYFAYIFVVVLTNTSALAW